mgnify:CR=1 FL=1
MRREKRNNNVEDKVKWGKLVSFIIAIILLIIAISASMSQEKTVGNISFNRNLTETNKVESASSDLSKSVNQILIQNSIGGDNEEESDDELNEIQSSLSTNQTENNVSDNTEVSTNVNNSNQATNTTNSNENASNDNVVNEDNQTNNEQAENKVEENNTNENTTQFIFPVEGEVIKEFAKDNLIYSETLEEWITHPGIDIKADRTTIVKSVADGTVKSIKNDPRYGLTVTIEHSDGYTSVYSSLLTAEFVKEGEKVTQGQTIGTVGNSAVFEVAEDNHLHFELLKDGSNINPEIYLK